MKNFGLWRVKFTLFGRTFYSAPAITGRVFETWVENPDGTLLQQAVAFVSLRFSRMVCRLMGHDSEASADPENGTEDVWCKRCDWQFHAKF